MHPHQMTDPEQIREFVFAGNARLTLVSKKTGARFTYRVSKPKRENGASSVSHFVGVLSVPENGADYSYLGLYRDGMFEFGRKSPIPIGAPSGRAYSYFAKVLRRAEHDPEYTWPAELEVWHEGRCGRCGRTLTVPESIARGIGPECAGRM